MAPAQEERPSLKFRLPRGRDPVRLLRESGFQSRPAVHHEDTWFERPEGEMLGAIVLRRVLPDRGWRMAWETTIRTGPEAEPHHLWTDVDGPRMWKRLERLGMRPVLTLEGVRTPMDKGTQHLALERIPEMGDFLEVPKPSRGRHMLREWTDLLHRLGATGPERGSYRHIARGAVQSA